MLIQNQLSYNPGSARSGSLFCGQLLVAVGAGRLVLVDGVGGGSGEVSVAVVVHRKHMQADLAEGWRAVDRAVDQSERGNGLAVVAEGDSASRRAVARGDGDGQSRGLAEMKEGTGRGQGCGAGREVDRLGEHSGGAAVEVG